MATHKLLLLPGDGIGPEVMAEVKKLIAWMNAHGGLGGHKIDLVLYGAEIAGAKSYDQSLQEMCAMMTQDHKVVASVIANITVTNNMAACMQKYKGLYVTDGGYMKSAADWSTYSYMASPNELDGDLAYAPGLTLDDLAACYVALGGNPSDIRSPGRAIGDFPGFSIDRTAFVDLGHGWLFAADDVDKAIDQLGRVRTP